MYIFYYSEQEIAWGFGSGSTQIYNCRQREGARRREGTGGEKRGEKRLSLEPDPCIFLPLLRGSSQN